MMQRERERERGGIVYKKTEGVFGFLSIGILE
jgi:hypothetical protein